MFPCRVRASHANTPIFPRGAGGRACASSRAPRRSGSARAWVRGDASGRGRACPLAGGCGSEAMSWRCGPGLARWPGLSSTDEAGEPSPRPPSCAEPPSSPSSSWVRSWHGACTPSSRARRHCGSAPPSSPSSRAPARSRGFDARGGADAGGTGRPSPSCSPRFRTRALPHRPGGPPCGPVGPAGSALASPWRPKPPPSRGMPPPSASSADTAPNARCGARDRWPPRWEGRASGGTPARPSSWEPRASTST